MIALIQRVTTASVAVDGRVCGEIGPGLLVFLGVERADGEKNVLRMSERVLTYRVFADASDRMNESLLDQGLALLVVPQFTLAADTRKGTRASFSGAHTPDQARIFFELFVKTCKTRLTAVEKGVFGANMEVSLVNSGPVTFWLEA